MPESYTDRPRSRSPFIVTPYVADGEGRVRPQMPSCCPRHGGSDAPKCALKINHTRERKTGPAHSLMVIQCRTHQISFTLYPPAYTPYARRPVQKLAPDGSPVHAEGEGLHREFSDTLFAAALDGEAGRAWIREGEGTSVPSWTTQSRHLSRAARLIGIASDLGDRVRETIAAALSVGNLLLRERAAAKGFRAVGKAVCDILRSIRGGRRKAFSLLTCGHLAGLWGIPLHWDARRKALERSPFCDAGTVRVT